MIPQSRISGQIRKLKVQAEKARLAEEKTKTVQRRRSFHALTPAEAEMRWESWLRSQNFKAFPFQRQAWQAFHEGRSMLIAVPTGSGKTLAAAGGPLMKLMTESSPVEGRTRIIYLTPLKALARDIAHALERPIRDMGLPFQVGLRTGDTSASSRQEMRKNHPEILVTTPESFAILLTGAEVEKKYGQVFSVVIDEGHELLGTKRGSLLELSLATLKEHSPELRVSVLSATLGNLEEAARVLTGALDPLLIAAEPARDLNVEVLTPPAMNAAPWLGYSGLKLSEELLKSVNPNESQIIFTNTRASAEAWYRDILERRPDWKEITALHHGSLSKEERERVEAGTKSGEYKIIVATSSLELGVDFPQVGRVYQVGSVKSLARAVQRAGRGYHRPGEASHLTICPSNLFEILEGYALRQAIHEGVFEVKEPLHKPLDVFVQFLLNRAFNDGFTIDEIKRTLQRSFSFRDVSDDEIQWALHFLIRGGVSLSRYPQFMKLQQLGDRYLFADAKLARLHRMNIGTIVSDDGVQVKFMGGKSLGVIGETFVSKLKKGDVFHFAGRELEYVQLKYTTLFVKLAQDPPEIVTVWIGNVLPMSGVLCKQMRETVDLLAKANSAEDFSEPELQSFWPVAERQKELSKIPLQDETLVEIWKSREGFHLFVHTWAGRLVNEGLGHLFAYRIAQISPNTISVAANDHGFELMGLEAFPPAEVLQSLFTNLQDLDEEIEKSLNFPELAKRSFREVARVSGLIQSAVAGQSKNQRNLQMSSGLLFDVFENYEKNHPLVLQAKREVRQNQLKTENLRQEILNFQKRRFLFVPLTRLSPFAFPLFIERARNRISTEKLEHRIARFQRQILEDA